MKCYECKWLDRSVVLTSNPPKYGCTLGFGSHYADHECEYDFMPIVRCKDCFYLDEDEFENGDVVLFCNFMRAELNDMEMDGEGFCSNGERREP